MQRLWPFTGRDEESGVIAELIDGDVGRSTDQDLATIDFGQMIDDGGRGDGLASTGRTLDQAEGLLQDRFDGVDLRTIQFW